jgi:hypothetical protein
MCFHLQSGCATIDPAGQTLAHTTASTRQGDAEMSRFEIAGTCGKGDQFAFVACILPRLRSSLPAEVHLFV